MHTSELAMPFHYFHTFSLFLLLPNAIEKKSHEKLLRISKKHLLIGILYIFQKQHIYFCLIFLPTMAELKTDI